MISPSPSKNLACDLLMQLCKPFRIILAGGNVMVVLLVIATFIVFIGISILIEQLRKSKSVVSNVSELNLTSSDLYIHPSHTFARLNQGLVEIGMDEFSRNVVGDNHPSDLPQIGQKIKQHEIVWKVNAGTHTLAQRAPVDGIVSEINHEHKSADEWIIKIKPLQLDKNLKKLVKGLDAKNWVNKVKVKFSLHFSDSLVPAMQDGGELVNGFGKYFTDAQWQEFCKEFFETNEYIS